jgi:glycerol-1-phosphate dehydrogenase [NAD(P)+]
MKNFDGIFAIAQKDGPCNCGKEHRLLTQDILLERGALAALPEVLKKHCPQGTAMIVCDGNTYEAAGRAVEAQLSQIDRPHETARFDNGVIADEAAVETLEAQSGNAACFVAVGSGTINDICRYVAFKTGKKFISVPTAPSMDGYVSSVAAMTFGGCKVTTPAAPPCAVVADTDILAASPMRLMAAGVGDILGKYTCLCDWEISSLISDETYCTAIAGLEFEAAREVLDCCPALAEGDAAAVENLTYALVLSGLAMQLSGDSRPASGAEHHLSHFWEMRFLREGRAPALHGAKVGVATVIIARLYHEAAALFTAPLLTINPPFFNPHEIKQVFGPAAEGILKENTPDPFSVIDYRKVFENKEQIARVIDKVPDAAVFRDALEMLGAPATPADLGIDDALAQEGLNFCVYIRRRMTLLRLLKTLGPTKQ